MIPNTNWTLNDFIAMAKDEGLDVKGSAPDALLKGITADSRKVRSGFIYAAMTGVKFDGHGFIEDALRNGAVAIICSKDHDISAYDTNAVFIVTPTTRSTFAKMAAKFYNAAPETIVAVTGTNGKTSVVHYVRSLWEGLGLNGASLGTLGVVSAGRMESGGMTTPDPASLHAELADLASVGVTHLAMEASSHGLSQYRLEGVKLKAAAFTNISHDHLDYHKDMDEYYQAKARLFFNLLPQGTAAVINVDEAEGKRLADEIKAKRPDVNLITYGKTASDIKIAKLEPNAHGQSVTIEMFGVSASKEIQLVGDFQTYNLCAALGLVYASMENPPVEKLLDMMPDMTAPRGRLQSVPGHSKGAGVFIDYAHTPSAMSHILHALRSHTKGKLIVVFGCGGDRDKDKRPIMGRIASELADHVIVTDDNPRSENPDQIRREIIAACPGAEDVGNRAYAIHKAIMMAGEGDIVVIAGKGHERGQIIGSNVIPFDDLAITQEAVDAVA